MNANWVPNKVSNAPARLPSHQDSSTIILNVVNRAGDEMGMPVPASCTAQMIFDTYGVVLAVGEIVLDGRIRPGLLLQQGIRNSFDAVRVPHMPPPRDTTLVKDGLLLQYFLSNGDVLLFDGQGLRVYQRNDARAGELKGLEELQRMVVLQRAPHCEEVAYNQLYGPYQNIFPSFRQVQRLEADARRTFDEYGEAYAGLGERWTASLQFRLVFAKLPLNEEIGEWMAAATRASPTDAAYLHLLQMSPDDKRYPSMTEATQAVEAAMNMLVGRFQWIRVEKSPRVIEQLLSALSSPQSVVEGLMICNSFVEKTREARVLSAQLGELFSGNSSLRALYVHDQFFDVREVFEHASLLQHLTVDYYSGLDEWLVDGLKRMPTLRSLRITFFRTGNRKRRTESKQLALAFAGHPSLEELSIRQVLWSRDSLLAQARAFAQNTVLRRVEVLMRTSVAEVTDDREFQKTIGPCRIQRVTYGRIGVGGDLDDDTLNELNPFQRPHTR